MSNFSGELFTAPNPVEGPPTVQGDVHSSGSSGTTVRFFLTAICSAGNVRHYWTDTSISTTNAPACAGTYSGLTVLGSF